MTEQTHEGARDEQRAEDTLLGSADEVEHPSIEEQVDEQLQREKDRDDAD
jgi:hypothetical protein